MDGEDDKNPGTNRKGDTMDMLLEGGCVITMNESDEIVENGRVLIDGGEIVDVASDPDTPLEGVKKRIDCSGKIVMPGLSNCHAHLEEIVQRG
jgi:cytosine/adenosine deaminase-related metal-dependent hydrolase